MTTPLLTTKLYVPPVRPALVPRPRLIERLNEGLHLGRKLTLISAPAGFGKTTLVSEWVHRRGEVTSPLPAPIAVAWLSLDKGDNDPIRFLSYLVAALETVAANIGEGVLDMLHASAPQPPPSEAVLTSLINEVAAIPDRVILILDDYHTIESSPVDDALSFLLEHLPPWMHVAIATREDPHLPLARLRGRGQMTELRATDLRFSSSEAAAFLNQLMGLDLSGEDITALETRTEGWVAGLQLAAISMQGHKDTTGLIKAFSDSHRFVLDYLVEEVLEMQPESVQSFLPQTALLDRLTGSLCDVLTGREDGQQTLEMLERANLFIVPLDAERRWYRYHHLFADLLRPRLRQTQPGQVSTLHGRASVWYEQNGFIDKE
jgi:LuxR family maltose regulon positive regulatory protein